MEATLDHTDRPRYLTAPTRPACEIDALLDELRWALTEALAGPGDRRYQKARKHAREFAGALIALLEWTLERGPSSEASGDLHAYFDACVAANASAREREASDGG